MGRIAFRLPDIGEGIATAEVTAWHVKIGEVVEEDAPLVDVMTDKATVEIPAPVRGRVMALHAAPGETVAVGAELLVFETEGDGAPPSAPAGEGRGEAAAARVGAAEAPPEASSRGGERDPRGEDAPARAHGASRRSDDAGEASGLAPSHPAPLPRGEGGEAPSEPVPRRSPGARPLASPAVRRRAFEAGLPLQFVTGTGPEGRITHADLDRTLSGGDLPSGASLRPAEPAPRDAVEEVPVIGLRRRIAERMQDAKRRIPHFSYIEEVDVTALEDLRKALNDRHGAARPRLTLLPFLVRALAKAVPDFPGLNARFDDAAGVLLRHAALHLGIATQTPAGLVVPVLRHAEGLDLWACAAGIARLAETARAGRSSRDELSGSTLTLTSLGALGGLATTPVINAPEVAIVGVNKIAVRPVYEGGALVPRKIMNLSSSFDHRVVDGWIAAEFVQRLKTLLEQPATLFLE